MKKNILSIVGIILLIALMILYVFTFFNKANKSEFTEKCPKCESENIYQKKPIFTHLEHLVIPTATGGGISKPIAHFKVKYYCKDCDHSFKATLEKDLFLKENQKNLHIEYKE